MTIIVFQAHLNMKTIPMFGKIQEAFLASMDLATVFAAF